MQQRFPVCRVMWLALVISCAAPAQPYEPQPPGQLLYLGGRRIHLNCSGQGAPAVIVENGGGSFSVEWDLVQRLVSPHMRICAYDRAGYAWSDRGPVDEGIEQIMDDLHLLVSKARIPSPFILVGHSLGCLYARAYQRRFSEQVAGLVFVDGSHDEGVTLVLDGKRIPISRLSRDELPRAHREYLRSVPVLKAGAPDAPPLDRLPPGLQRARQWAFEKLIAEMGWLPNSLAAAESWRQEFGALRRQRQSGAHPLGSLPLRVLERERDTDEAWHTQQVQLAALSAAGRLIRAERSGHMIHLERADLVARAILDTAAEARRAQ